MSSARAPDADFGDLSKMWTHGELHPGLVNAIDVCYCYTMGPSLPVTIFAMIRSS